MSSTVLIFGTSARAAAWSALRAGLTPVAVDRFADRDLVAVARCVQAGPEGLSSAVQGLPAAPWVYTGGVENRPGLVRRLAAARLLWGVGGEALRRARDPLRVARVLRDAGLPALDVRRDPRGLPRDGSWLRKPLASAGGYRIGPVGEGPSSPGWYYQQRAEGEPLSALFVAGREGARLCGVGRQLIGRPGAPFAYTGGVAPWPVSLAAARRIEQTGVALAEGLSLVGLFGVDLVLTGDDVPLAVEVNPRYTASVELFELASGRALMDEHRRVCTGEPGRRGPRPDETAPPGGVVAKEYVFADRDGVFAAAVDPGWMGDPTDPFRAPRVADVPHAGTTIRAGEPVLTVLARGPNAGEALARVAEAREEWSRCWDRAGRVTGS